MEQNIKASCSFAVEELNNSQSATAFHLHLDLTEFVTVILRFSKSQEWKMCGKTWMLFLVQCGSEGGTCSPSACCYFQPHLLRPRAKMQLGGQKTHTHPHTHLSREPVSFDPVPLQEGSGLGRVKHLVFCWLREPGSSQRKKAES